MKETTKPAVFNEERQNFVKIIYDELFNNHPELLMEERKDWFDMYVKYPYIKGYDEMIIDKYGDDCQMIVEFPVKKIKAFTYEFLKYIEAVLADYGYKFFIPEI